MKILVTGGAGYIGSHTLVELAALGYEFVVFDNLSNSHKEAIRRVERISGRSILLIEGDIRDIEALKKAFTDHSFDAVIHFAGLKAVGESVAKPLEYYDNNVVGTIRLLEVMRDHNCKKLIFSSSATVYGDPASNPIDESFPVGGTTNPYGTSKYMIERILDDLTRSDQDFRVVSLRYFNPVGAHKSGLIGEDPDGLPNNLMPFISQVAVGKREFLSVFGDDYPTRDGTGDRDYIHVVDLAIAHTKALEYLISDRFESTKTKFNIGTGRSYTVLEVIKAYEKASGVKIAYKIAPRRDGDIATCYALADQAKKLLEWQATMGIDEMCRDSYNWQSQNPNGYR